MLLFSNYADVLMLVQGLIQSASVLINSFIISKV